MITTTPVSADSYVSARRMVADVPMRADLKIGEHLVATVCLAKGNSKFLESLVAIQKGQGKFGQSLVGLQFGPTMVPGAAHSATSQDIPSHWHTQWDVNWY